MPGQIATRRSTIELSDAELEILECRLFDAGGPAEVLSPALSARLTRATAHREVGVRH